MTPAELIDRYCDVWNEPEVENRRRLLGPIWAADASYTDPTVHAPDGEALIAHITKIQERRPGARVLRTSWVDVHHGLARFAWHVVQADGTSLPEGLDIAFFTPDGNRIGRIIGFFGPLPRDQGTP